MSSDVISPAPSTALPSTAPPSKAPPSSSSRRSPTPFSSRLRSAKRLYSEREFSAAVDAFEELLSEAATAEDENKDKDERQRQKRKGGRMLADIHLNLAKCYKALDDVKGAIASCNAAVSLGPKWKDPFLYRSACFQALHEKFIETDGDAEDNIDSDRKKANIVVDESVKQPREEDGRAFVARLDEAVRLAKDGDKIFVERGQYEITTAASSAVPAASGAPFFLCGKSITIIGASTRDCVLNYKRSTAGAVTASSTKDAVSAQSAAFSLDTFLICASEHNPVLLKRLTFRNMNPAGSPTHTRFLGVASGTLQIEDCVFEGADGASDVDAIYTNSKIAGSLADNLPPPKVHARYCVFDHCQSFAAFTVTNAIGIVESCYFVGSRLTAMENSRVTVEHCEFAQTGTGRTTEQSISASGAELSVHGCYIHGVQMGFAEAAAARARNAQAVAISVRSSATVSGNYIYRTGNGVSCLDSDLVCTDNLIISCSKKCSEVALGSVMPKSAAAAAIKDTTLGHHTGLCLKHRSNRIQVVDNDIENCDVAVYVGKAAMPTVKGNTLYSSYFTGLFAECGARPNVMGNRFIGTSRLVPDAAASSLGACAVETGLGALFILESGGLVGKNSFENYDLSPLMVFASCRPMIKGNTFSQVKVDRMKQEERERRMRDLFCAELFTHDTYFYIVDSEATENHLRETIQTGEEEKSVANSEAAADTITDDKTKKSKKS